MDGCPRRYRLRKDNRHRLNGRDRAERSVAGYRKAQLRPSSELPSNCG